MPSELGAEVRAFFAQGVQRLRRGPISLTAPAPRWSLPRFLQAAAAALPPSGGLQSTYFAPPGEIAVAGAGSCWQIDAGRGDGEALAPRIRALFRELQAIEMGGADALTGPDAAPRLYGGLAFAPGARHWPPWSPFGDGRFVLPRWSCGHDGARGLLRLCLAPDDDGAAALQELDAICAAMKTSPQLRAGRDPQEARVEAEEPNPDRWARYVRQILQAVDQGAVEKVVAARRTILSVAGKPLPTAVLAALCAEHPGCTPFLFRCAGASFLGATPELLVRRRGGEIRTEALAGTAPRTEGEALLRSEKDRAEHALVVREILAALQPLCSALQAAEAPALRPLRDLVHLHTPIRGALREDTHVLELVAALHPTPAVGGVPRAQAWRIIADHEPQGRGWFAGPIGWIDGSGDGTFAVALRAGVLLDRRAYLYAGAGIVRGSDPASEYQETALKQRALLRALGAAA